MAASFCKTSIQKDKGLYVVSFYQNKILSKDVLVRKVRISAKIYRQYVDNDVLIVYAKSKQGPFYTYEFHAGREHFQHLAGVHYPKGAVAFYERCLDDNQILTFDEITPKESLRSTSAKIDVLPVAIDLTKAKAYRCGEKDLITLYNVFEMAIGNNQCLMGFDKRTYILPIPVTVMDKSIYEFCSEVHSISLIMLKKIGEERYSKVFYEATRDIISKADFGENVLQKVDNSLLPRK